MEEYHRDDNCDLCEAARITEWFHEDEICWIAECEICAVPMVVWRGHGVSPPTEQLAHMHDRLAMVVSTNFEFEHYVDDNMRNIPDHYHAHAAQRWVLRSRPQAPATATVTGVHDEAFPMRQWGLPFSHELDRVVIVSPHLDDAVLGTANFMAAHSACHVVTVFAGNPPAYPDPMRLWDVQSGFGPSDDVMEVRRKEDHAALAVLEATPVHLDFIEHTYNPGDVPVAPDVIAPVLAETLSGLQPTLVLAPFGLANPDHDVTHRACLLVRDELSTRRDTVSWWCYEDTGYKHIPGLLACRIARLFRRNIWPTPVCPPVDTSEARKSAAVNCYPTQLLALEDDWRIAEKLAAPAPEQYWRLDPPPPGWEGLTDRV